jgi:hypothetical protein
MKNEYVAAAAPTAMSGPKSATTDRHMGIRKASSRIGTI